MKFKLPLIAAFVGALSLTACGGGGSDSNGNSNVVVSSPASLVSNDVTVGTGATVANGSTVSIDYKVYLYSATASDFKGAQVDAGPYTFTVGVSNVITGLTTGIVGMKVGGHRILLIPASQAYGASGYASIPPNSGVVFDMTLSSAK
jgi:FKBP-type peptidyl-prolyl cis-trans isomerase FkpA